MGCRGGGGRGVEGRVVVGVGAKGKLITCSEKSAKKGALEGMLADFGIVLFLVFFRRI